MFLTLLLRKALCSYHVLNFRMPEGLRSYKLCSYKKKPCRPPKFTSAVTPHLFNFYHLEFFMVLSYWPLKTPINVLISLAVF